MRYLSTRGKPGTPGLNFCDILLEGLAPDGGLFLPETYPRVDAAELARWRTLLDTDGYAALAQAVLALFIDDIPEAELRGICERAYNHAVFGSPEIVPVTEIEGGLWLAHLAGGPTAEAHRAG